MMDLAILEPDTAPDRPGSQTLLRGLDILDQLSRGPLKLAEVSERLSLTPSTAQRLVTALVLSGFLTKLPKGKFGLGPKLVQLGVAAREQTYVLGIAREAADALSDLTGLCVFVGSRQGDWAFHLHRSVGRQRIEVSTRPGTSRPLADTGLGKALMLDDSPESWQRLFVLQEAASGREPGDAWREMFDHVQAGVVLHYSTSDDSIRSVAAPIRDVAGTIVAGISIASPRQYLDESRMAEVAPQVLATAESVSARLGWQKLSAS